MDDDKIFIPMSVEQVSYTRSNYFASDKKLAQLVGVGLALGITTIFLASSTKGSIAGLLGGLVISSFIFVLYMRFSFFEERAWKKLYVSLKENKQSNHEAFWGIMSIEEDGVINYRYGGGVSLKKAVVLKLTRGSKIGKPDYFHQEYYSMLANFYRELFIRGYEIRQYSVLERKSMPDNIAYLLKRAMAQPDGLTKRVMLQHINNLARRSKELKSIEVDYLMVYANNAKLMRDLPKVVESVCKQTLTNSFFKSRRILARQEVMEFISYVLQINTFPETSANATSLPDFSNYGVVYRLFDTDGNEIFIDEDLSPQKPTGTTAGAKSKKKSKGLLSLFRKSKAKHQDDIDEDVPFNDDSEDGIDAPSDEIPYELVVESESEEFIDPVLLMDLNDLAVSDPIEDLSDIDLPPRPRIELPPQLELPHRDLVDSSSEKSVQEVKPPPKKNHGDAKSLVAEVLRRKKEQEGQEKQERVRQEEIEIKTPSTKPSQVLSSLDSLIASIADDDVALPTNTISEPKPKPKPKPKTKNQEEINTIEDLMRSLND